MKGNRAESFTGDSIEVISGRTRHRGMNRGRKRIKEFLILAIGPVSKDTIEDTESSTRASDLDIVGVVVVIGVVVGISDEGNSKKASVRTIVGVVVIVNVGNRSRRRLKGETFSGIIDEEIQQVRC